MSWSKRVNTVWRKKAGNYYAGMFAVDGEVGLVSADYIITELTESSVTSKRKLRVSAAEVTIGYLMKQKIKK